MTDGRRDLIRALGAVAGGPAGARAADPRLGLGVPDDAEHTGVLLPKRPALRVRPAGTP